MTDIEQIAKILTENRAMLAVAESCTGGYLSHLITAIPGSSKFFKGAVVSYTEEIKKSILNVRDANLKKYGVVSEFVVQDMAINLMGLYDVDFSIATSGIAGPDGGTPEKPVGTVWIAVATTKKIVSKLYHFDSSLSRIQIVESASHASLNLLLDLLKQTYAH